MQAVIFAAGKSTRTYPLTLTKPKPLLKVLNKPILEHILGQLQGLVEEAIIIIGYRGDMIKKTIGSKYKKIKVSYVEQKIQNGNGAALQLAKEQIKDKFLVINSDDLFSKNDIKRCLKKDLCILVKKVEDLSRFGEVVIENRKVQSILEKPGKKPGYANTGLLVLSTKVFDYKLKKSKRGEYEITDYIRHLTKDNHKIDYVEVEDYWIPITYPWSLIDATEFFITKTKKQIKGNIESGAIIKGDIMIGKSTIVKSGAYIEGPVVIGENCKIGPNCYIRPGTVIGNNSYIGNAVEIKNTIIGDNVCIGHLSYFGDSIIGDKVNIGAGTIAANLRHDNKNISTPIKGELIDTGRRKLGAIITDHVHTGIHTSIYPGRKIWPDKTTLPGEIVKKDIK